MTNRNALGEASVLARFFRRPTESVRDFADQIKMLTDADRIEMAQGAARELGLTQDEVSFTL